MRERQRNRVVLTVILRQSKAGVRAYDRERRVHLRRYVVHAIEMIPLREVMIHPQSADILNGIATQNGVEAPRNSSIGRINWRTKTNFREISINQSLDCWIEKPSRNIDKFAPAGPGSVVDRVIG